MAAPLKELVEKNTVWSSVDSVKFQVNDITEDETGVWIHYTRLTDNTQYNCLVDAFLQRFRELPHE